MPPLPCRTLIWALVLVLSSCTNSPPETAKTNPDQFAALAFWQPDLLYLLSSPHKRMHVEVDAVEGCEPPQAQLESLKAFLTTHCKKPNGINIVRDQVIPAKDAKGLPHNILAQQFVDGPPKGQSAAFLYVLFYDGALCDQTPTPRPKDKRERNANPHVTLLPYPATIYINTRYWARWQKHFGDEMLIHEAGHILGLSRREHGTSKNHCQTSTCLMHPKIAIHFGRLLTGRDPILQHTICPDCAAELKTSSQRPPPSNLRFVGPVLVRSEIGYHVLSLPEHIKLIVGTLTDEACIEYAARVREASREPGNKDEAHNAYVESDYPLSSKDKRALHRATSDPSSMVREVAEMLVKAIAEQESK